MTDSGRRTTTSGLDRLPNPCCTIEGCDRPRGKRRGWCERHYYRWRATGQFEPRRNSGLKTDADRFWPNVDTSGDCWLWTGHLNNKGYGTATRGDGSRAYAHRISYELHQGPIPAGMILDHACFNPACVNPEHLRAITAKQNMEHRQGASRNSKTGVRGVYPTAAGKFVAQAAHRHIGTFDTVEEAADAVREARLRIMTHSDSDRHHPHPAQPCPADQSAGVPCPCQKETHQL